MSGRALVMITLLCPVIFELLAGCSTTQTPVRSSNATLPETSGLTSHGPNGTTYVDRKYGCSISVSLPNWSINPENQEFQDSILIAEIKDSKYGVWGGLYVHKQPMASLEEFANKGTFQGDKATYTRISGKNVYTESKQVVQGGFSLRTKIYKHVDSGVGYLFSFGYLSKFDQEEELHAQIDQIVGSFTLKGTARAGADDERYNERLKSYLDAVQKAVQLLNDGYALLGGFPSIIAKIPFPSHEKITAARLKFEQSNESLDQINVTGFEFLLSSTTDFIRASNLHALGMLHLANKEKEMAVRKFSNGLPLAESAFERFQNEKKTMSDGLNRETNMNNEKNTVMCLRLLTELHTLAVFDNASHNSDQAYHVRRLKELAIWAEANTRR